MYLKAAPERVPRSNMGILNGAMPERLVRVCLCQLRARMGVLKGFVRMSEVAAPAECMPTWAQIHAKPLVTGCKFKKPKVGKL